MPGTWGPCPKPGPVTATKAKTPPREVTKDQVNETNAHQTAQALREELDRDAVSDDAPPKPLEAGRK